MPDFPQNGGDTAATIWTYGTRRVSDATGITSDAATIDQTKIAKLDATISSRGTSTLTQAQIVSDSTPFLGARIDAAITSRGTSTLTQAQIISDATPFLGASVATIKTKTDIIGASVALETGGNLAGLRTDIPTARATKIDKIQDFLEEGTDTLTADGTEQIVRAYVGLGKLHAYIDLTNMVAGNSVTVRQYMTIKTAGTYVKYAQETYADVQTLPLLHITMKPGKFGVKVTLQQAAVVYKTYDWETLVETAAA